MRLYDRSILGISADLRQLALIIILSLSILITAPLGAIGIGHLYIWFLEQEL